MASNIYKLYILQIIGALYGTYIFYKILTHIKTIQLKSFLSIIGRSSLLILCIHSIDWNMLYTTKLTNYIASGNLVISYFIDILLKLSFTYILFILLYKNTLIRKIYNIQ